MAAQVGHGELIYILVYIYTKDSKICSLARWSQFSQLLLSGSILGGTVQSQITLFHLDKKA